MTLSKAAPVVPIVLAAVALTAGAALAFGPLPSVAEAGLTDASDVAGQVAPVRAVPDVTETETLTEHVPDETLDAAGHGDAVSSVATGDDPTPETNKGADVSAAAKMSRGLSVAASHRPDHAGKPDDAGKSEDPGEPAAVGPEHVGQPADTGRPAGVPPVDAGKPAEVPPLDAGKPAGVPPVDTGRP
jgi:hypothetical protein